MSFGKRLRVGITHGDINGIGYEIILKILADNEILDICTPVVFGSSKAANYYRKMLGMDEIRYHTAANTTAIKDGSINLINIPDDNIKIEPGVATAESGHSAIAALDMAADALQEGEIDVLVTAPINKTAMQMAKFGYPGHTEYLENKLGDGDHATMTFLDGDLRVSLLTTHLPMSQMPQSITQKALVSKLEEMDTMLRRDFACTRPLIAVLALNPHAGDHGLLGDEEQQIMVPAIEDVTERGIMVSGPYPADGFFGTGAWKKFDAVLAMYHDQGLVAFKTLSGTAGINYTAGLPYVRTSPDHGTGYDIVGKGIADPMSLRHAIYAAIDIYRARLRNDEATLNPLKHHTFEKNEKSERRRAPRPDNSFKEEAAQQQEQNNDKTVDTATEEPTA